jgi:hypothetical protein
MDLGFSTHALHMDHRFVKLESSLSYDKKTLTVTGPPTTRIYPPGPGFLYVVADGVPSFGRKTMIGSGASPPVDQGAIDKFVVVFSIWRRYTNIFSSLLRNTEPHEWRRA